MDWQSDVYVYEDCDGGWVTHVAGRRYVFTEPMPPPVDIDASDRSTLRDQVAAWIQRDKLVDEIRARHELQPIGLPHDGGSFRDPTPGACCDRLLDLRSMGYTVPQGAIDALREEQAEADGGRSR